MSRRALTRGLVPITVPETPQIIALQLDDSGFLLSSYSRQRAKLAVHRHPVTNP